MKERRETIILRYLESNDFLSTFQAAELLRTSPATVRREFARLAENRSARRVQGGLKRLPPEGNNSIPFTLREQWHAEEKAAIALRAREFLNNGDPIFIHGGSTTLALANHIDSGTVITNSVAVCGALMQRFPAGNGPEVILPGGTIDLKAGILFGSRTEAALREYYAGTAFFSARGMDDEGILDTNDQLAAVARMMIRHAEKVIMLADRSKFRKFGMSRMILWPEIDILITGDEPENYPLFNTIRKHGVRIITV